MNVASFRQDFVVKTPDRGGNKPVAIRSLQYGYSLGAKAHLADVKIYVETQKTLVFHLIVLSDHQNIFFGDQVIDAIGDLLGSLCSLFDTGTLAIFSHYLLDYAINYLSLWRRLLALSFELFNYADDKHWQLLELIKGNLYFFVLLLARSHLSLLILLGLLLLSLHPEQIIILFLFGLCLSFLLHFSIQILLIVCKLDIWLDDVDIGGS